jgi:hypothetical protein
MLRTALKKVEGNNGEVPRLCLATNLMINNFNSSFYSTNEALTNLRSLRKTICYQKYINQYSFRLTTVNITSI